MRYPTPIALIALCLAACGPAEVDLPDAGETCDRTVQPGDTLPPTLIDEDVLDQNPVGASGTWTLVYDEPVVLNCDAFSLDPKNDAVLTAKPECETVTIDFDRLPLDVTMLLIIDGYCVVDDAGNNALNGRYTTIGVSTGP